MSEETTTKLGKICPECGVSMDGLDPFAHALTHWPDYLDPARSSKQAMKRQELTRKGGVSWSQYLSLHEV